MLNTHSNTKSLNFKGIEVPNEIFKNAFLALLKHRRKCLTAPTHLWNYCFMFLIFKSKNTFFEVAEWTKKAPRSSVVSVYLRLKEHLKELSFDFSGTLSDQAWKGIELVFPQIHLWPHFILVPGEHIFGAVCLQWPVVGRVAWSWPLLKPSEASIFTVPSLGHF